jgi:ABC-type transport system involved in cytochrome c biogenesis permease subunit
MPHARSNGMSKVKTNTTILATILFCVNLINYMHLNWLIVTQKMIEMMERE